MTHRASLFSVAFAATINACAPPEETRSGASHALDDGSADTAQGVATPDCVRRGDRDTCTYARVGSLALEVDVFTPAGPGPHPALLWIHGGALIMGHRNELGETQRDAYLAHGYAVVAVDYRLAPETKLESIHQDIASAYGWLRGVGARRFALDPDRVGIVGHSAGGYLTLASGARLSPRPKVLVSFYGYGDITTSWLTEPWQPYVAEGLVSEANALGGVGQTPIAHDASGGEGRFDYYLYCRQRGTWTKNVSGHDPRSERAWFAPFEGIRGVGADYPPTVLLHGERDDDVPFSKSVEMDAALTRAGVEHDFVRNAEWGHGFDEGLDDRTVPSAAGAYDASMTDAWRRVFAMLDAKLR